MGFLVSTFIWGGLAMFLGLSFSSASDSCKPKRDIKDITWKELILGLLGAGLFCTGVFLYGVGYGYYLGGTP